MTNRDETPQTDQYYLDIAHDLPGYNWRGGHGGGIEIGWTDPGTDERIWLVGSFSTFRDAMVALGRHWAPPNEDGLLQRD